MSNEIEKVASGQSIVPVLEGVAVEAWENHDGDKNPIEANEHVSNPPPTFLQQLKERRKGIVTGVCVVGCTVAGVLLAYAFIGAHYNSIPPRDVFNPVPYGGLAGGYFGYLIARILNQS